MSLPEYPVRCEASSLQCEISILATLREIMERLEMRLSGTMKNRTAHLRWWAERIGRPAVVPSNGELGIANREYVTNEDRSVLLDPDKLALVKDEHVVMALRMEAEFGLRREEAIKFTPSRDDRGDRIRLKGSTTKGGRPREIPVRNESQRRLLDEVHRLAGGGALIPPDRNYKQQLKVYENRTREAGLYRMHGLRHYSGTRIIPDSLREAADRGLFGPSFP